MIGREYCATDAHGRLLVSNDRELGLDGTPYQRGSSVTANVRRPGAIRALAQSLLESASRAHAHAMSPDELAADAVVISPHPDDETLGCGGTLLRKRATGARVAIIFMTDGTASHQHRLPSEQLAVERESEAREAAAVLGVDPEAVHFIRAPDSQLSQHVEATLPRVVELLEHYRPAQLYAPFHRDGLADHVAAASLAERAATAAGVPELLGFPVWFWNHWPWMRPVPGMIDPPRRRLVKSLVGARALLRELRVHVDVAEQLPTKMEALARHRSQMQHRDGDPAWLTLADVAGGDFLARLLRDREIFARRRLG
jgi:LmbE family N-acetylglucosaminyl deacetylase